MFTSLDIVIPVYNSASWVIECISSIQHSLKKAELSGYKIFVVNDGSTDALLETLEGQNFPQLQLINQENKGRAIARLVGARASQASHILFVDSRVRIHEESISYVLPFLNDPKTSTWTADVSVSTQGNALARFWMVIERVFWRRYYKNRSLTEITPRVFDYFPKGTTSLVIAKEVFIDAAISTVSTIGNPKKVNDDTALLRHVNRNCSIMISPEFSCTYYARSNFLGFLKHAYHRGSVLIDGHWRKGTRLSVPISTFFVLVPFIILLAMRFPVGSILAFICVAMAGLVYLISIGAGIYSSIIFATLAVPFGFFYFSGMIVGVQIRLISLWKQLDKGRTK